jgi:hypothetical protein
MQLSSPHAFHIPVMGMAYTIDSPLRVAKFGISSVLSINDDQLLEQMREVICSHENLPYKKIQEKEPDHRAKRITAYLNLLQEIIDRQIIRMKMQDFEKDKDINQYFEMLPENSSLKQLYLKLDTFYGVEKEIVIKKLKSAIVPGSIDVNIMTKVDKTNVGENGEELPQEFSDAQSALRGYARSNLNSSVVFSAGMNPRLYGYCEKFSDFYPDAEGQVRKKIILKVSDYRSALIQGKFLAKKGLLVSEFRIESGINCGVHVLISGGLLLGPILEEFKTKREELKEELYQDCQKGLSHLARTLYPSQPELKVTAQGGIGTSEENDFLSGYYNLNSTGWGSPFLLVPEVTNVDEETLHKLATAKPDDYYVSHSSPLGIPFNNFRKSSSEIQRKQRISKHRSGSPCYKKFLISNKEFTSEAICTASREYQKLKVEEIERTIQDETLRKIAISRVEEKECLCEGLGAPALIVNKTKLSHNLSAVAICPGPNLAFFSGTFSLKQMVDHIYGRLNLLNTNKRPNLFINELQLYADYLKKEFNESLADLSAKRVAYLQSFKNNLNAGIEYYEVLLFKIKAADALFQKNNKALLQSIKESLNNLMIPSNAQTTVVS